MKAYRGHGGKYAFKTSALYIGDCSASSFGRFSAGKQPQYQLHEVRMAHRTVLHVATGQSETPLSRMEHKMSLCSLSCHV